MKRLLLAGSVFLGLAASGSDKAVSLAPRTAAAVAESPADFGVQFTPLGCSGGGGFFGAGGNGNGSTGGGAFPGLAGGRQGPT